MKAMNKKKSAFLAKNLADLEAAKIQLQHRLATMTSPEQSKARPAMKKSWKLHRGTIITATN